MKAIPPASWKAELRTSSEHMKMYRRKRRRGILERLTNAAAILPVSSSITICTGAIMHYWGMGGLNVLERNSCYYNQS